MFKYISTTRKEFSLKIYPENIVMVQCNFKDFYQTLQ